MEVGPAITFSTKLGMAQMLRGGVVVEVKELDEAIIAEIAGARCVVVSVPSEIKEIMEELSIPVMAKVRVGHSAEAKILESIGVKYIEESTGIADANMNFINKHDFGAAFVCGCRDLGEALRRITEGSAMVRVQGDSGDMAATARSVGKLMAEIRALQSMAEHEVFALCGRIGASHDVVSETRRTGRLPVALFAAGGITTAADAAEMMKLGCDGVVVGQEVSDIEDSVEQIEAIVEAVGLYSNVTEISTRSEVQNRKHISELKEGR